LTERDGGFLVTLYKDNLTEEQLAKFGLNARQVKTVLYAKEKGKITNGEYQEINATTAKTAFRDLDELVKNNILEKLGENKSTHYKLKKLLFFFDYQTIYQVI